jgi:hypothetical protein
VNPLPIFFPFHSDEESAVCISAYCLGLDYETERGEGNDTGFVSDSEQAFNASQCSSLNTFLHAILSRVTSR